jgi:5-methyltetrahydropteroyltriglutamate--homocysteine methyltransferase
VIDVKSHEVESPAVVAERIRQAAKIVPPERITVNPDCGLVHLPRDVTFAKLCAMVEGTRIVRRELGA